jgi:hypothetical protein
MVNLSWKLVPNRKLYPKDLLGHRVLVQCGSYSVTSLGKNGKSQEKREITLDNFDQHGNSVACVRRKRCKKRGHQQTRSEAERRDRLSISQTRENRGCIIDAAGAGETSSLHGKHP